MEEKSQIPPDTDPEPAESSLTPAFPPPNAFGNFPKKYIAPLIALIVLLPALVISVLGRQSLLGIARSARCQIISRVFVNPGQIQTWLAAAPIGMSALAYNSTGEPIATQVTYQWGISSDNSIGDLRPRQEIAQFIPLRVGQGNIWVRAKNSCTKQPVMVSVPVFVTTTAPTPTPTPRPTLTPTPTIPPTPTPVEGITFTEFLLEERGTGPQGITRGPDGAIWFIEAVANKVSKITTNGTVTKFLIPTSGAYPTDIENGPDGNIWFTESKANKIGKISPQGIITEYPTSGYTSKVISGPDGNIWFTLPSVGKVGKITPNGTLSEYPACGRIYGVTPGPDGNIWFTCQSSTNGIQKMSTDGTIVGQYTLPSLLTSPTAITIGPDNNLWFTEIAGNQIGKITTTGVVTSYQIPTLNSYPVGISSGPDRNLWFAEFGSNKVAKITTQGVITEFSPFQYGAPIDTTTGPDQNVWYADYSEGRIVRINLR